VPENDGVFVAVTDGVMDLEGLLDGEAVREGETEVDGVNVDDFVRDCVMDLVGVPVAVPPVENVEVVLGV